MGSSVNVDQVLFTRAKWRLKFMVPCWGVQIVMLLCLMGIFAYRVAETVEHYSDEEATGRIPTVEIVWESTNVGFSTLALICTIIEISKMATETLTPFAMLCTHVLKLTLAFAMLSLDITVHIQGVDHNYSIVGLALDCAFLAVAIATFVYSLKVFRRVLKFEQYQATETRKMPGTYHDLEMGNSVDISSQRNTYGEGGSGLSLKAEVDRRISAGLSWSSSTPTDTVDRTKSIVVGKGVVPSAKASPAEMSLRRSRSYVTERGVISEDDESDEEGGHMRVSEEEERDSGHVPRVVVKNHDDNEDEDRKALLGHEEGATRL
ncbi:hypothetical protein OQA88_8486 [Cercophora sp. LCS_1]